MRRLNLARTGIAVLAVLGTPSLALALDLQTEGEFTYDLEDNQNGTMSNGTIDAYDTWGWLTVNGVDYDAGGAATISPDGRHVEMRPATIDGLTVQRIAYVPATVGEYIRFIDVISNPGATPRTVTLEISGNLGSDSGTNLYASSSGDTLATVDDEWFGTDDASDGSGDPSLAFIFQSTGGSVRASTVSAASGGDNISWSFTTTVPAGRRVAFVTFAIQHDDRASAAAEAARIMAFPADALEGMRPYASDVVNFALGVKGPGIAEEGAEITLEVNSAVFSDTATWSWDLDNDGTYGEMPNVATYTVPAGTTDGPGELIFGLEIVDGTETIVFPKRIHITNVAPTITSEPPSVATGAQYRYQIEVEEPGGAADPLVYRLGGSPPPGMEISAEGLVSWRPPAGARGRTFSAAVRVLDDDGGQDVQTWEITVGENTPPEPPNPVSPLNFAQVDPAAPIVLVAENGSDPDGDLLTYSFQIAPTSDFRAGLIGSGDVPEGADGMTSWTVPEGLTPGGWYWRAWVSDASSSSEYRFGAFTIPPTAGSVMPDGSIDTGDGGAADAGGTPPPPPKGCSASASRGTSTGALLLLAVAAVVTLARRRRDPTAGSR